MYGLSCQGGEQSSLFAENARRAECLDDAEAPSEAFVLAVRVGQELGEPGVLEEQAALLPVLEAQAVARVQLDSEEAEGAVAVAPVEAVGDREH